MVSQSGEVSLKRQYLSRALEEVRERTMRISGGDRKKLGKVEERQGGWWGGTGVSEEGARRLERKAKARSCTAPLALGRKMESPL